MTDNWYKVRYTELIAALERDAQNTDTDPRWIAARELRRLSGVSAVHLMIHSTQQPMPALHTTKGERNETIGKLLV